MNEITVVVPNYNGIKFVEDCFQALYKEQTQMKFDMILVDNGSKDGSRELVERKYKDVRVIPLGKNTGFCKAVNVGIKAAVTPYVILLNNDTKVCKGFVKGLYETIRKDSHIFSVSSMMIQDNCRTMIDDAGDFYCSLGWAFANGKDKSIDDYEESYEITAACAGAAIYRKSVFEQIGYFDEAHFAYLEDVDVGIRSKLYGYKNLYEPKARVYHVGSGASGSRYNEFKIKNSSRNSIYIIRKNFPLVMKILNLPFLMAGFAVKLVFFIHLGFGKEYLKGLCKGLTMPLKDKKVRFLKKHWKNYVRFQLQLWSNMGKRLK